nr:tetratricopeptide repeat protein [uncultured Sphingosinicella sp.]
MKSIAFKIAASGLVMGTTVVGCAPAGHVDRTASLDATPVAERNALKLYERTQSAVQQGNHSEALTLAERLVELAPRDAGYRMLLGDLYLKNGRFISAESAFSDVLTLDPRNPRASLSLALALTAQGKTQLALGELDELSETAAPGDVGLAYALAGQPQRAITMLEPAAREPNATGRVRQNLALAYALAGDWQKARVTASQDVSPADLSERLAQWAEFASPGGNRNQVAMLLGVTAAEDPGQPVRLALAAEEPQAAVFAEAPVSKAPVVIAAPAPVVPIAPDVAAEVQYAAAAETLVKAQPAVIAAPAPVTLAPLPAFAPSKTPRIEAARPAGNGRFVVQIGAYKNPVQVEIAWSQAQERFGFGPDKQPVSTTVKLPGRAMLHRLSVGSFEAPRQAARVCQSIKAKGGACFVRTRAGDAPVQWAARHTARG